MEGEAKRKARSKLLGSLRLISLAVVGLMPALTWTPVIDEGIASGSSSRGFCQIALAEDVLKRLGQKANSGKGIQLASDRPKIAPGEVARARFLNFTSGSAFYGAEFKIQRYGPEGWSTDPSSPDGPWKQSLAKLAPSQAGHCYRFSIPKDQSPGLYRFIATIQSGSADNFKLAEFRVRLGA